MFPFQYRVVQGCEQFLSLRIKVELLLLLTLIMEICEFKSIELIFLDGYMERGQPVIINKVNINLLFY
jgi:hypothetical protein